MKYLLMGILFITSIQSEAEDLSHQNFFDKTIEETKKVKVEESFYFDEEKNASQAAAKNFSRQSLNKTIEETKKVVASSDLSDSEKQFFYNAVSKANSFEECGAMVCLSELDIASEKCDHYIKKYFKVRAYKRKFFGGKVFDPKKTVKKRFKYLDRCKGPKKEKKVEINLLYGFLYKKP